jgi:hypothetical protein
MPGQGPFRRTRRSGSARNADPVPETVVVPDARPDKPDKPPPLRNRDRYSDETRRWYDVWARSPQATTFADTDWQRLWMIAPMVNRYFAGDGDPRLFGETRLNEALLGATSADRQRLRLRIADDGLEPARRRTRDRDRPDPRRLIGGQGLMKRGALYGWEGDADR